MFFYLSLVLSKFLPNFFGSSVLILFFSSQLYLKIIIYNFFIYFIGNKIYKYIRAYKKHHKKKLILQIIIDDNLLELIFKMSRLMEIY